jgi:Lysyl-tRNA synthetase (class II)
MSDLKTESQDLQQEENALIALRKEKLAAERAKGNAFPNDFRRDSYCNDLQKQYADKTKEELEAAAIPVKVAGRIMLNRGSFMVIQDMTGRIQVYVNRKTLPEETLARSRPGTWATSSAPKAPWPVPARATCTSR